MFGGSRPRSKMLHLLLLLLRTCQRGKVENEMCQRGLQTQPALWGGGGEGGRHRGQWPPPVICLVVCCSRAATTAAAAQCVCFDARSGRQCDRHKMFHPTLLCPTRVVLSALTILCSPPHAPSPLVLRVALLRT